MFSFLMTIFGIFIAIFLFIKIISSLSQDGRDNKRKTPDVSIQQREEDEQYWYPVALEAYRPINAHAYKYAFKPVETYLKKNYPACRLLAEVPLGAFIRTEKNHGTQEQRERAYSSYGHKRVDFLIIAPFGEPVMAIEYDGSGHEKSPKADKARAIKETALEEAGIPLVIIEDKEDQVSVLFRVEENLILD